MTSLKILYVDTEKVWRGGQEQLFSLMRGMKNRGHQVWLASPSSSPLSRKIGREGIQNYSFSQRSELSPLAFFRLWRIFQQADVDIVHFNTPTSILLGGLAARISDISVQLSARRVNFQLKSSLSHLKYNWSQGGVVTVSRSIRQTLIERGVRPDLVTVIYEGVDLEWIDRQKSVPLLSRKDSLVVGTVGHLSPEKGHETLLEAVAQLAERFPRATYIFVGEGPLKTKLTQKADRLSIAEKVMFTGFRSDSEALMKEFDVFCLPSLSEGLSSAILAAMANRLPVIAAHVGGIPELVVHGKTGFLVPSNNPELLVNALSRLLTSEKLRCEMGKAGRKRVENHFNIGQKLDKTENLYLKLLHSDHIS